MKIDIDITPPRGGWWRALGPYVLVPLVVFAAGLSRQTDIGFWIFCLAVVVLVLVFGWLRESACASKRDNATSGSMPNSTGKTDFEAR